MRVAFADFWTPFDSKANIFVDALRALRDSIVVSSPEEADLLICSIFGDQHDKFLGKTPIIRFLGEPRTFTPAVGVATLGFDFDDETVLNYRLPLWLLQFDWFCAGRSYLNPNSLIQPNLIHKARNVEKRKYFAVSVFNHDPIGNRVRMLEALIASGLPVSAYGKPFGNWFYGEETKLSILTNFQFNICFENSLLAGYHTEKLIHAYFAGCIPVYWGSSTHVLDFNPNAYLFLHNGTDETSLVQEMIEIANSPSRMARMIEQPLFQNKPSVNEVLNPIEKALKGLKV